MAIATGSMEGVRPQVEAPSIAGKKEAPWMARFRDAKASARDRLQAAAQATKHVMRSAAEGIDSLIDVQNESLLTSGFAGEEKNIASWQEHLIKRHERRLKQGIATPEKNAQIIEKTKQHINSLFQKDDLPFPAQTIVDIAQTRLHSPMPDAAVEDVAYLTDALVRGSLDVKLYKKLVANVIGEQPGDVADELQDEYKRYLRDKRIRKKYPHDEWLAMQQDRWRTAVTTKIAEQEALQKLTPDERSRLIARANNPNLGFADMAFVDNVLGGYITPDGQVIDRASTVPPDGSAQVNGGATPDANIQTAGGDPDPDRNTMPLPLPADAQTDIDRDQLDQQLGQAASSVREGIGGLGRSVGEAVRMVAAGPTNGLDVSSRRQLQPAPEDQLRPVHREPRRLQQVARRGIHHRIGDAIRNRLDGISQSDGIQRQRIDPIVREVANDFAAGMTIPEIKQVFSERLGRPIDERHIDAAVDELRVRGLIDTNGAVTDTQKLQAFRREALMPEDSPIDQYEDIDAAAFLRRPQGKDRAINTFGQRRHKEVVRAYEAKEIGQRWQDIHGDTRDEQQESAARAARIAAGQVDKNAAQKAEDEAKRIRERQAEQERQRLEGRRRYRSVNEAIAAEQAERAAKAAKLQEARTQQQARKNAQETIDTLQEGGVTVLPGDTPERLIIAGELQGIPMSLAGPEVQAQLQGAIDEVRRQEEAKQQEHSQTTAQAAESAVEQKRQAVRRLLTLDQQQATAKQRSTNLQQRIAAVNNLSGEPSITLPTGNSEEDKAARREAFRELRAREAAVQNSEQDNSNR